MSTCRDCQDPARALVAQQRCSRCYQRYRLSRNFVRVELNDDESIDARLVVDENGCHVWQGARNNRGYGQLRRQGRPLLVHRVQYERKVGPIPDGLVIDHLCRNPACANPEHLEVVTQTENMRRAVRSLPSKCRNGHLYAEHGIETPVGQRCRICREASYAKHRDYKRQRYAASKTERVTA